MRLVLSVRLRLFVLGTLTLAGSHNPISRAAPTVEDAELNISRTLDGANILLVKCKQ